MNSRINQPIETLRLSDRDKTKLLWAIEQANKRDAGENARRLRVPCRNNKEAVLTLKVDGGGETPLAMLVRNLSRWGAALVNGRYVHPETRCELTIQSTNGVWHKRLGIVRHSRHIQGMIHEIGVQFDDPIELDEFVVLTPAEETRYLSELADDSPEEESSEVIQLSSKVIIADDFASDRNLYGHWLSQAGLTITTISNATGVKEQVQKTLFDLLVTDCQLGEDNGLSMIKELRSKQFVAPIIAISADESSELEQQALDAGANAFLSKPFTQEQLVETVYKLVGIDASADLSPIYSSLKNDAEMRPLLTEFTRGLANYIDDLRDANSKNDYDTLDHLTQRLKGAGNGYGFPEITDHATQVLAALNEEMPDIDKIKLSTGELVAILNRIKLR